MHENQLSARIGFARSTLNLKCPLLVKFSDSQIELWHSDAFRCHPGTFEYRESVQYLTEIH